MRKELDWGPGLTRGVNAKLACRDWLKFLDDCIGSIVCP